MRPRSAIPTYIRSLTKLSWTKSSLVLIANSDKLAHNEILLAESVLPPLKSLQLVPGKICQGVKRTIQVLGQHILIEAALGQTPRSIATREVGVRPAGTVEVATTADIEDPPAHGEVHGGVVLAAVREESPGGEGLEDDGRFFLGKGNGRLGPEEGVDGVDEDTEEEDIKRGKDRTESGEVRSVSRLGGDVE